jgi:hypothetical protein
MKRLRPNSKTRFHLTRTVKTVAKFLFPVYHIAEHIRKREQCYIRRSTVYNKLMQNDCLISNNFFLEKGIGREDISKLSIKTRREVVEEKHIVGIHWKRPALF